MTDDADLLHRYVADRSEEAFAELVRRHIGLVYHSALRQLSGDAHRAEDVAQSVFTDLARKAAALERHPALVGWLHTSTRFAATKIRRAEQSRQKHEREADMMRASGEEAANSDWEKLCPIIDDVIHELSGRDQTAVLLRFFEDRSFAEIGTALRLSEDAARMRVNRALEKLRARLARRGVSSAAAALALGFASHAGMAAPAGLAVSITTAALTNAAAAAGGSLAALSFMSMNTLKVSLAAALVLAGAGGLVWQHRANARLEAEIADLRKQSRELAGLRAENDRLAQAGRSDQNQLASLQTEVAALRDHLAQDARELARATKQEGSKKSDFTLAKGLKPVDSFANAGRATPRAALETLHWALSGGDVTMIARVLKLSPDARQKAEALLAKLPPDQRAQFTTPEQFIATLVAGTSQAVGMQVMSQEPGAQATGFDPALANDPIYQTLHEQAQFADGRVREANFVLEQGADGWQVVVPAWQVEQADRMLTQPPANKRKDKGN
ncbi:MAG TPA: sigma-70 family RNA polymerase sigma factor [Opitutaceae bacterium]|nr:sigma-70 family RNA polymerase sigma factor [Opitutaceae bacterium]